MKPLKECPSCPATLELMPWRVGTRDIWICGECDTVVMEHVSG